MSKRECGLESGAAADRQAAHTGHSAQAPTGRCCLGDAGPMAVIPRGAHRSSSKSTTPFTERPGIGRHRFALTVPFPTCLEAEIACGSLAPDVEPHQRLVGKELKASGGLLEVRWSAEDPRLLRISIINFLDQLSLVVNTIQRFGPPLSR
ncbi:EKC/KEOPS complex subunit Lage3-like [Psammomys obesus]|uniref:EKC/KEOPS complex subunit Lage3-like n=1 Tax=Psammomys obesus TaxID=48139 RepID=UPI0024528F51|nr:EKC/KEOPS complex subunit Lage3-like [Psammomys obesus]